MKNDISQLITAAERRQRILDFLRDHAGARMDRIREHLRGLGDQGNIHNTIRTMADWGEIRFDGVPRARQYFALQATTRSAEDSRDQRLKNTVAANEKKHRAAICDSLKHKGQVYHPGEHPIKNQGGQGAVRPRVFINCAQLW